MPRMDGRVCLKELKRDAGLKHIFIIIYTTSSQQKERDETLELGAAYFPTKASSSREMREGIAAAIERLAYG